MKRLLNNKEDFDSWRTNNDSFDCISYDEDEPKYYPCVVTSMVIDAGYSIRDDLYYEFVYLQDFSELSEDDEEFSDYELEHVDIFEYVAINKEDISIGDYIGIEYERFGSYSCRLRIVDIQQRYDAITGEPYKIVTDEEDEIWSTQSGQCISNPGTFYEIYGYFRKLE